MSNKYSLRLPSLLSRKSKARQTTVFAVSTLIMLTTGCDALSGKLNRNCSAPGGKYEQTAVRLESDTTSITGQIQFSSFDFSTRWGPVAKISFTPGEQSEGGTCYDCAGMVVEAYEDRPGEFQVFLRQNNTDTGGFWIASDVPADFKITIEQEQLVKLEIGGEQVTAYTFRVPRDHLQISCSSANADFRNIEMWSEKNPNSSGA
ncbi:MAG: hypothetical protein ACRCY3_02245 [Sphingorhabdus sp.]